MEKVDQRYFKNRRGGLGQYYLGVLRDEYRLLGEHKNGVIDFTVERGKPMAEAVAAGVDSNKFFRSLEADKVPLADLDSLSSFCSCQLRTKARQAERALLLDTVVGQRPDLSENAGRYLSHHSLACPREQDGSRSASSLSSCAGRLAANSRSRRKPKEKLIIESGRDLEPVSRGAGILAWPEPGCMGLRLFSRV